MSKLTFIPFFLLFTLTFFCYAEEPEPEQQQDFFTLQQAIDIALQNNYDIQNQQLALDIAKAKYKQVSGSLDIEAGAQALYSMKQNPVDKDDPNYKTSTLYGDIYSGNTLSQQTGGSVYLKKLFGFGLETKLSYSVQRAKKNPDYEYSSGYLDAGGKKIKDEKARSTGEVALELSLPLFKSFKNSLTSLQIGAAKDYIEQMEFTLSDTISRTLIDVSLQYWNYLLAHKNVENLEALQKKIEERNDKMNILIQSGVRSKNDLLAMQVNVNENRRQLQEAKVQYHKAKMELVTSLGISDVSLIGEPENSFSQIDLSKITPPETGSLDFAKIEENRTDLKSLKKQVEAAAKRVRLTKADSLPDVSLNLGVGTTGAAYSDDFGNTISSGFKNVRGANFSSSLGVTAKLGNKEKRGVLDQANAEYKTTLTNYNKAKNTLKIQIQNAAEKLEIYKNLVSDADDVLTLQKKLYENEQKRFNAGLITVDNLLNQDQKYISAEVSYYQVLINYMQSIMEFNYYTANYLND